VLEGGAENLCEITDSLAPDPQRLVGMEMIQILAWLAKSIQNLTEECSPHSYEKSLEGQRTVDAHLDPFLCGSLEMLRSNKGKRHFFFPEYLRFPITFLLHTIFNLQI
jgi:hypothetical protein